MFRPGARTALETGKRFFTVTTLENGFVVATRKNNLPVAKVTVAYGGGSRHEAASQVGTVHMLRSVAFQSTQERSAVKISRDSELRGTQLSATSTREMIAYSANCHAAETPSAMSVLADAMMSARNEPYELDAQRSRMKLEAAAAEASPHSVLFDAIHKTSFPGGLGKGLGNSVFAPDYRVGSISKQDVDLFVEKTLLGSPQCLVAHGVEHNQAVEFAEATFGHYAEMGHLPVGAKFVGGNSVHIATGAAETYGVVGFQAFKFSDPAVPALRVLEAIVDGTPAVKYGRTLSPVYGPSGAAGEAFTSLYSDAGIMGVIVEAKVGSTFGESLRSVCAGLDKLASGAISAEQLKAGKSAAKLLLFKVDESAMAVDDAAEEIIMSGGKLVPVAERAAAIDAVTLEDLKAVAKKVLGGPKNLVTHGNSDNVPSLAEL